MPGRPARRIAATEVKTHFGRIVQEVVRSDTPVIIQTRGQDQAAIISMDDLAKLSSLVPEPPARTREHVRTALREAGLLSKPPPDLRRRAEEYDAENAPEEQARLLSQLRGLHLDPSLSDIILTNRDRYPTSKRPRKK